MNNQQALVEQIVQNLAFEVEAVPINKTIQASSICQSTPLNVKIRVRKKDDIHTQHDISSITDEPSRGSRKIRLVSSDQTIMTFDVFMEADFDKKRSKRPRRHIFDILKPVICLGAPDDDDYSYMPTSSYIANLTEPSVTTRSDGVLTQKFTLSKNIYQDYTVSSQSDGQEWLFGKCKPGGCLDPPFSEDKYSYKPSTRSGPERIVLEPNVPVKEKNNDEVIESDVKSNGMTCSKQYDRDIRSDVKSNGRQGSIFDSGLFRRKRKSSEKSTNTKSQDDKLDETDSILNLYQVQSTVDSLSTHSNSIITYPPEISSDLRISDDKTVRSRGPSEDKSRKSFNDHSEPYFIPPKRVNRIKERDTLNQTDHQRLRSSDNSELRKEPKESLKIPVPLVPIPIPVPWVSNWEKSETIPKKDDISETPVDNSNIGKVTPDTEVIDRTKQKDTGIPERQLEEDRMTGNINLNPVDSLKMQTLVPINTDLINQQPAYINSEMEDKDLSDTKLQPPKAIESKIKLKDSEQPEKKTGIQPSKIPIPIPVLLDFSNPDRGDTAVSNTNHNYIKTNYTQMPKSEQSFENKTMPPNIKGEENSNNVPQNIVPRAGSEASGLTSLTSNTRYSDVSKKETESISKNYLRIKSDSFDQESDPTESKKLLTHVPIIEGGIKCYSKGENIAEKIVKPAKHVIKSNDDDNMEFLDETKEDYLKERSEKYKIPDTGIDDVKSYSNELENEGYQRISQFLPSVLQKDEPGINDSNKPAASIEDNLKMNKIERKDTDLSNNDDKIKNLLRSEAENGENKVIGEMSPSTSIQKNIADSTKPQEVIEPNNDDKVQDSSRFTSNGSAGFITAPLIIDKNEQAPQIGQLKDVYSETDLIGDPKVSETQSATRFGKFYENIVTPSTVSHELIGTKSVIYDLDDYFPATCNVINTERYSSSEKHIVLRADTSSSENISNSPKTSAGAKSSDDLRDKLTNKNNMKSTSVSSVLSTSTMRSALKKDTISVEMGFHSYLNDKNEIILRTFDAAKEPKRFPKDSVTIIKSQIKTSSNEIRIPVDSDHDLAIQIKKANTNHRVSISESGLINVLDKNSRIIKHRTAAKTSGGGVGASEMNISEAKEYNKIDESDVMDENVMDLYEQELVPLQLIIKNLRNEIDILAAQQLIFRNKIFCPKKSQLPRLVHSNKKCFGCIKK